AAHRPVPPRRAQRRIDRSLPRGIRRQKDAPGPRGPLTRPAVLHPSSGRTVRVNKRKRVVIIGAGPGGICASIRLKHAGYDDFVVLDKAPSIGGTWFHNRYPGCACDVQSHLYSFSFEIKRDWSRPYATQPEILEYMQHCVDKYELAPHIRLSTEVTGAFWDDEC